MPVPGAAATVAGMISVRYRIDARDRISELGEGWQRTEGSMATADRLVGRELWSFIVDPTTIELYRRLVKTARTRGAVRVPYRCDTAKQRRWFEMAITPVGQDAVEFASTLVKAEDRPPVALLDDAAIRDDRLVRMCSWCQRIALPNGDWQLIEEAMRAMRLLERDTLPRITHGICPDCVAKMRRQLNDAT